MRRNFTDSHLNPQVYKRWFIGERAAPRQIEQRETRINEIASELIQLNKRETALRERLALTRDKIRPLIELEHALEAIAILPERNMQHATLTKELEQLDLLTVETLKADVEKYQRELTNCKVKPQPLNAKLGSLEEKIKQIETESIPGLERSADGSIQSAESFLIQENADDETKSEVQKEYERRRERQPLEVILQNASRYENEYQTAEQRSRDRLREAKQIYSMRYDFGTMTRNTQHATSPSAKNWSTPNSPTTKPKSPISADWPNRSWLKTSSIGCANKSKTRASNLHFSTARLPTCDLAANDLNSSTSPRPPCVRFSTW